MSDWDDDDEELVAAAEEMERKKRSKQTEMCCYTDGCCLGNGQEDCPGGYGFVVCEGKTFDTTRIVFEKYDGSKDNTTNNKMEMTAVLKAMHWFLKYNEAGAPLTVELYSDSEYTLKWFPNVDTWERKGWISAAGKPIANQDLWIDLRAMERCCFQQGITIKFNKVKAHLLPTHPQYDAGNAYADMLANKWQKLNNPAAAARRAKTAFSKKKK